MLHLKKIDLYFILFLRDYLNNKIIMTTQIKVVRATYYPPKSVFKIPKSIDIEDKSVVKSYWVRYNELCIVFVDPSKDMLCIEPYIDGCESEDYKDPMTIEVVDADEEGVSVSDDEE